ncbi:ATP-binding cassette domain-containing protein [Shimia sp. R11_0]|nr:ATP-binding cassette domain-containing protein [Shimia sp. R11_0]
MMRVSIENLSFAWPGQARPVINIDVFSLEAGERVLLQGPSGSGKSSLLSAISGVVDLPKSTVQVVGQDMGALTPQARDRFRANHIGMIFQGFNLIPWMTAAENVCLPLKFSKRRKAQLNKPAEQVAQGLMVALGLPEPLWHGCASAQLSVGQQQRVAVARALMGAPELILADEPTSALDELAKHSFLNVMMAQVAKTGASLLMVSHDTTLAPHFDRVVQLSDINTFPQREAE